jgi:hypothetical protein
MAKKKQESLLGLAPVVTRPKLSTNGSLAVPGSTLGLDKDYTPEEQWTLAAWRQGTLVIDATASKTLFGAAKIAELHQRGDVYFSETLECIWEVKHEPRDAESQRYMDEWSQHQIQLAAQQLSGTLEVGAYNIGVEVHRSLHPPEIRERERPGFWARLWGG